MANPLPCPGRECDASLDLDHGSKGMALIASQAQGNEICPMVKCVCGCVDGNPCSGVACEGFEFSLMVNFKYSLV